MGFFSKKAKKEVLLCFKMFKQLGISLKKDEKDFRGKKLLKRAMQRWLPAAEALMEMIVLHLPSPWLARQYRTKAFLPVAESFGFTAALRSNTGGQAFPHRVFDHWEVVSGNAMTAGKGMANEIVMKIRKRKAIGEIPPLDRYLDKL